MGPGYCYHIFVLGGQGIDGGCQFLVPKKLAFPSVLSKQCGAVPAYQVCR